MIELSEIGKTYRLGEVDYPALVDINLTIGDNEYLALTGASGSGKSTLMNILGCLDTPTSGHYELDGIEVANLDDLMLGHQHLKARQRQPAWGVGRHIMGSQIFDYWYDPDGFQFEHYADGDVFTADVELTADDLAALVPNLIHAAGNDPERVLALFSEVLAPAVIRRTSSTNASAAGVRRRSRAALPANRAIALGKEIGYVLSRRASDPSRLYLLAEDLVKSVAAEDVSFGVTNAIIRRARMLVGGRGHLVGEGLRSVVAEDRGRAVGGELVEHERDVEAVARAEPAEGG